MMPESPAWPVAAKRIQDRERVGGEQRRAGKGPLGGKAGRSQQSLGRRAVSREAPERPPEAAPSCSPTPEGANEPAQSRICSPH